MPQVEFPVSTEISIGPPLINVGTRLNHNVKNFKRRCACVGGGGGGGGGEESERIERLNRNDSTAQHIGQHFESR